LTREQVGLLESLSADISYAIGRPRSWSISGAGPKEALRESEDKIFAGLLLFDG